MPLVRIFETGPVITGRDSENALRLLETGMNAFMVDPEIEVRQVNGPYATHLPPREELPGKERIHFTASILYTHRIKD
ncbi:MAG: hypothetical protein ABIH92_01060 [Nanoarchaeota archaeon]